MTTTIRNDNRIGSRRQSPHSSAARRSFRRGRTQSGASLIEIMIVLIILLIGVFLAIRIFPAGFGVLAANDNRSRAVRLAEQLLGDTQNNAANLPQGVLMEGPLANSTTIAPILNQDPDSLATYTFSDNTTASDVNRTRFIKGEPVKIPVATSTVGTGLVAASQYILRFGPIALDPTVGIKSNAGTTGVYTSYLNVVSAPLVGYTVASNNPAITLQTTQTTPTGAQTAPPVGSTAPPLGPDGITNISGYLRGQTSYLVDYSSNGNPALIMFEGGADSVNGYAFEVSYSYQSSAGVVTSVVDQTLYVNQSSALPKNSPVWQGLPLPASVSLNGVATNVVPGSVSVRRAFTRISNPAAGPAWSTTSPYEYCLGQDNNASSSANVGQLYFNPAGANFSVPGPSGQQPFMAYVDYSVLDWHILHDDVQVPSVSAGSLGLIPVKTTFNRIKRIGDPNPDLTIYSGLFPNDQFPTDIAIFNLGTGALLSNGPGAGNGNVIHGVPSPAVSGTSPDFYIDTDSHQGTYETGTIYLNPNTVPAGSQLRILYKTDGDWAAALQKAYSQYLPVAGQTTTPTWIDTTTGNNTSGSFSASSLFSIDSSMRRIYFPRCDINKAVVVTLQYKDTSNAATKYVKTAPLQFTIDNPDGAYAYIDLVTAGTANSNVLSSTDQAGISSDANWNVVGPIIGVSVKARVIYKDNNNPNNSWRVQDIDSYLTPAS